MTMFIHSTDGIKVDGGLSLKDHSGEGCWFPVVWRNPECADDAIVLTVGYYRVDDHFEPIFVHNKQEQGEPMKYSTLSIKRELAKLGKWDAAKSLLTANGYWDDYVLANYLAETDSVFTIACAAMIANGIVTEEELKELLPKCIWTAE